MRNTIPLISTGTAGPLGILHLPRLWQKVSLDIAGKLHSAYPAIGQGFDQMLLDSFSIEKDVFVSFMKTKPTYTQLEAWIRNQKNGSIDQEDINAFNTAVRGYHHEESLRKEILNDCALEDNGTILDAVHLNNLDDWNSFHAVEIK